MRKPPIIRKPPILREPPVMQAVLVQSSAPKPKPPSEPDVRKPYRYRTQMGRDIAAEHARITARIYDPNTSKEQLERDGLRLEYLGRFIESESKKATENIERLKAEEERLKPIVEEAWRQHNKEIFLRKCWRGFQYAVVYQRIGHHLFKD